MKRRWLVYQLLSLAAAAAILIFAWQRGRGWIAQPWLLPLWVALVPVFQYQWLISGNPKLLRRGQRRKLIQVFVGTMLIQSMYVWLVFGRVIDWQWAQDPVRRFPQW